MLNQILKHPLRLVTVVTAFTALTACATTDAGTRSVNTTKAPLASPATINATAYPSTYAPPTVAPLLIRGATILTGTGARLEETDLLIREGKIVAIGRALEAPAEAVVIDARGKWVTPGIIDVHSHLGVYASPGVDAHSDGNEATAPATPQVWAEHSIWPQDPGFEAALEAGVTTLHVLPGSANLFGGRSVTVKNVPSTTYQGMKFPDAPHGLKMACGENPKRVYGNRRTLPSTRMGNVAGWRAQWIEAQEYMREQQNYERRSAAAEKNPALRPPKRDLRLETLAGVLRGEINIQHHCYRADEMAIVLDMAKEFGYKVTAFHHATEAYKISNLLAENNVCAAVWADWWGFKMESYDAIPENMVLVDAAPGGCAIVHSDSSEGIQRLNQEAAKGMAYAERMGVAIAPEHAIKWLTSNAAKALSVDSRTGSIETGKMADVVIWSGNPFSVYALAETVLIDGVTRFERSARHATPQSDFLLGQPAAMEVLP